MALNISQLNLSRTLRNPDDSHLLSKSMQADLKTLNLKKTFSFLQNLDYNDDEGDITAQNNMHVIGDRKPKNKHGFGFIN